MPTDMSHHEGCFQHPSTMHDLENFSNPYSTAVAAGSGHSVGGGIKSVTHFWNKWFRWGTNIERVSIAAHQHWINSSSLSLNTPICISYGDSNFQNQCAYTYMVYFKLVIQLHVQFIFFRFANWAEPLIIIVYISSHISSSFVLDMFLEHRIYICNQSKIHSNTTEPFMSHFLQKCEC